MSLTLSTEQEKAVKAQIDAGYYDSPSQVIDAALDLLELGDAASPSHALDVHALHQSVLKGLAEADAGHFVSQQEIGNILKKATPIK